MSELSQRLAELLDASVAKCTEGQDVAVAFSGGIDSSLVAALAKRHANSVRLYTVGARGSHDAEAAQEVAPLLGLELTVIDLPDGDIVENLREMISVTGTESPLTLAFEMPLFCVMGAVICETGMGSQLYRCAKAFLGHLRGGLGRLRRAGLAAAAGGHPDHRREHSDGDA